MRDYTQLIKKARASIQSMRQPDSTTQEDLVTMAAVVDALESINRAGIAVDTLIKNLGKEAL